MFSSLSLSSLTCVAALGFWVSPYALAQKLAADGYPSKPVAVVIPYTAGGSTDSEARLYTQKLQENTGQPFVFDFRPGAGTTIGTAYVAKAAPDGHTLLVNIGSFTTSPAFYPDLPYDVVKSFAPVSMMSRRATVFLVSTAALPGIHTLQELVAHAKANPGKVNVGTGGAGATTHLVPAALASSSGIKLTYVHYKGVAQSSLDLVAGRTHMASGTLLAALPNIKSGKLRVFAVIGKDRSKLLPDMKTSMEQGFDLDYVSWLGAFAPAATPAAIVNKLNAEIARAVRSPDVLKQLDVLGIEPVASTSEVLRQRVATEVAFWKKLVREEGIQLEE